MDAIIQMLTDQLGPLGPMIALGGIGLLLVLGVLPFALNRRPDPMDKFQQAAKNRNARADGVSLRLGGGKVDKLEKYSNFLEPQNAEEYSAMRLKLIRAGYRSPNAIRIMNFAQMALGIGFLVLGLIFALASAGGEDVSTTKMILYTLLPGGIGYGLPKYWVTKRLQKRQEEIVNGFPDSLDMMLVCVEAGQSMDHSIARVAKEIRAGYPALSDEYEMVAQEIKAGKDKNVVLKDMGERAGVSDVSNFVTVLIQSAAFGTSIAEALRVYASEMRDKRVMRAEEKANTLPTKMTLSTMMFTVPPLLIILLGPSVYNIVETLGKMGQ
ncbi:Bacterial type II secretion system protein F domain protein [Rhodobacteraceae bacterium THAF1]|uniref:type II secretion system F family protein n=1 Tax=Palleronia sp. THAF1 TaxID=2587842 RepID=UPI000F3F57C6|nr:type II secretion system F family protein [Palleronia sp. THAF1]QFU07402.1 Bacterial type II secretion system protein F domain protein [Palleronia sp. THAF1]VDC20686.1 Bacterial type II secretion system protein F domain protein [Rhodobacteraceae bacterium THAF1]